MVLHATDNTQAEMLFAKYANKTEHGNDCFVFCDENGAPAITLVKPPPRYSSANNGESAMKVPSLSLAQTAQATVARSECWARNGRHPHGGLVLEMFPNIDGTSWKMPVYSRAVVLLSRKARKKFLPPAKPEMGFGLLFVVKSENTSGHEKERVVKSESADATFHDDGDDDDDDDDDEFDSGRGSRRIRENEQHPRGERGKKNNVNWQSNGERTRRAGE